MGHKVEMSSQMFHRRTRTCTHALDRLLHGRDGSVETSCRYPDVKLSCCWNRQSRNSDSRKPWSSMMIHGQQRWNAKPSNVQRRAHARSHALTRTRTHLATLALEGTSATSLCGMRCEQRSAVHSSKHPGTAVEKFTSIPRARFLSVSQGRSVHQ